MRKFGYYRVGAGIPAVTIANPGRNLASILSLCTKAVEEYSPDVLVFPELSISGYSCADLFFQRTLVSAAEEAIGECARKTASLALTLIVGAPVSVGGTLYNCAVVIREGSILGIVPKTFLPNSGEFYEMRWFAPASTLTTKTVTYAGFSVPIGNDLLFTQEELVFGVEICEDLWAPVPPSSWLALAGANLILNPSASNELAGKSDYRLSLVRNQSARCLCSYVYASAGPTESTTDTVCGGHAIISENGNLLAELPRFSREGRLLMSDIDTHFLSHERATSITYSQAVASSGVSAEPCPGRSFRRIAIPSAALAGFDTRGKNAHAQKASSLLRQVHPRPFVPDSVRDLAQRCEEIFSIQSAGLASRLAHTGLRDAVIGLSGGLDSTLALLVTLRAFDTLGLDKKGIHCMTMPGFGTSARTRENAVKLAEQLGLEPETIDISGMCRTHMEKLGHSGNPGDPAYENIQARERTMLLMNRANMTGGIVIGTGDLSELALGWCTYNADHMSMYGVNAGVPKTLVRFLVRYVADTMPDKKAQKILCDIMDTPISPELLPPDGKGRISQKTEEIIGPYELHDFFLYYGIRCGFPREKTVFLAGIAFADTYPPQDIAKWSRVFYTRFFSQQFKRSCMPDGPKVGSISLSPRGDWRMPSDADGACWRD